MQILLVNLKTGNSTLISTQGKKIQRHNKKIHDFQEENKNRENLTCRNFDPKIISKQFQKLHKRTDLEMNSAHQCFGEFQIVLSKKNTRGIQEKVFLN